MRTNRKGEKNLHRLAGGKSIDANRTEIIEFYRFNALLSHMIVSIKTNAIQQFKHIFQICKISQAEKEINKQQTHRH